MLNEERTITMVYLGHNGQSVKKELKSRDKVGHRCEATHAVIFAGATTFVVPLSRLIYIEQ